MLQGRIEGNLEFLAIVTGKIIVEALEDQITIAQRLRIKWLVGQIDIVDLKEERAT